jgi:nucleotide-binding universal stress UspA family protein
MKRKIIIGFDDTPQGRDALALGGMFAETLDAVPVVASVYPWPHGLMSEADLKSALETESREAFDFVRDRLDGFSPVTQPIANRSVPEALTSLADDEQAQMIVVGSSHRGPVGRTLLGSTGISLVHGAPCAVAVAPAGYAERKERHLLRAGVAYDGSPEAWAALETGIGLAERHHGSLSILTVADAPHYGYATSWAILSAAEFRDFEREQKQRVLDLAASRTPPDLGAEARLLIGDAGSILAEASADFDVIVAGSRGYGPLKRTVLGSTTRKLIAGAACPVLVIPRATALDPLGLRGPSKAERAVERHVASKA